MRSPSLSARASRPVQMPMTTTPVQPSSAAVLVPGAILTQQCEQDNLFLSGIRNAGCIHGEDIAAAGWSEQVLPTDAAEERTTMAPQRQETNGWPTILWIAWREDETERLEPL